MGWPFSYDHTSYIAHSYGNLLSILNIGFVAGSPIGGFLPDRIIRSRKKIIIAGLILMDLSLLAMALINIPILCGWA